MKKNNFFSLKKMPDKIFGLEKTLILLFLPSLGLILLFLVSLNLVLRPKMVEIGEIGIKIDEIKINTNNINEQNRYLASIDEEELKKNADYLDNAVLRDKKSYLLVGVIRKLASRFNYQLESFSLTPGELKEDDEEIKISSSQDIVKMPVSLLMIGPKEKSLDLISALEKTLPILFIDKFETKISGNLSQLDLVVSSYYIKDTIDIETEKIGLNDLILSKEESDLIKRISVFTKIENDQRGNEAFEFQQYQRENPFSL
jgi:hypothetical protein